MLTTTTTTTLATTVATVTTATMAAPMMAYPGGACVLQPVDRALLREAWGVALCGRATNSVGTCSGPAGHTLYHVMVMCGRRACGGKLADGFRLHDAGVVARQCTPRRRRSVGLPTMALCVAAFVRRGLYRAAARGHARHTN